MYEESQAKAAIIARKSRREPTVNMTPMIDCVFLLIIFFMLATTFSPLPGMRVKLPPPSQAQSQTKPEHFILNINNPEAGEAEGFMQLNDREVNMVDLSANFMAGTEKQKETLIIRSGRRVKHEQIVTVMDKAKRAGVKKIGFAMVASAF
ncbi:MAG: biopolymer transporter ExbD [Candidatus Poribacteria bacterium]|nr:biopolymer transporter ExbD [Candidatus Poribacteria bacterium]